MAKGGTLYNENGEKVYPKTVSQRVYDNETGETVKEQLEGKQETLESGTNIKTINGQSVLGSGNIAFNEATSSNAGLMSAADKTKLDNVASTYETKADATSKQTAINTTISELQAQVAQLSGVEDAFFGGIVGASTDIATDYSNKGYSGTYLYMVGTDMTSLVAYQYTGSGSPTQLFGGDTYDFTDYSEVKQEVAALGPKISKVTGDKFEGVSTSSWEWMNDNNPLTIPAGTTVINNGVTIALYDANKTGDTALALVNGASAVTAHDYTYIRCFGAAGNISVQFVGELTNIKGDIQKLKTASQEVDDVMYPDAVANDIAIVVTGPYISLATGELTNSGNYTLYKITNNGYSKVKATLADVNASQAAIAFYTTDDISTSGYMAAKAVASQNSASYSVEANVPDECKLIVVTNRHALLASPSVKVGNMLSTNNSAGSSDDISSIAMYFTDMSNSKVFTKTDIRLLKSNGTESDGSGYSASDYIKVREGDKFEYSLYSQNAYVGLLNFYNENKAFQSCVEYFTTGDSVPKTGTWTAPSNGYVRVCSTTANLTSCFFRYKGISDTLPNRVKALEGGSGLPDYWQTHLAQKKSEINTALQSVGATGDTFIFFTDYHWLQNTGHTPDIIRELQSQYPIGQVVCGGDIMNTETDNEALMSRFEQFVKAFDGIDVTCIFGNHDYNPYGSTEADIDVMYPILQRNLEKDWRCTNSRKGYFYRDNVQQKIRYIFTDTYKSLTGLVDNSEQVAWLISTLQSVQDGWYVVIFGHIFYEWVSANDSYSCNLANNGQLVKAICDALQNRTSGTYGNYSFDFSSAHGKVACVISGHTHIDIDTQSSAGYSIVSTDRDAINYPPVAQASSRTEGTSSEQVIDFVCIDTEGKTATFVRIGGGSSRTFTFV